MAEEENKEIERPVEIKQAESNSMVQLFHGRRKITIGMSKKDFYNGSSEDILQRIVKYLPSVLRLHNENRAEIDYLYNYYKGVQPILNKKKIVRPEINNIVEENHAYEIVEFKKSYIYGSPIQYVQKNEEDIDKLGTEISKLNRYIEATNKSSEDKQIAEWQYICGTAYRFCEVNDEKDEDNIPFTISSPDPRRTFVVYSGDIEEKPLFSGYISYANPISDGAMVDSNVSYPYTNRTIDVYTDDFMCKFTGIIPELYADEEFEVQKQKVLDSTLDYYPFPIKGNRIIEYPLNNSRLGLIELVMSSLNAINQVKSDDIDGIDQFVQSLIVFINQEIDVDLFKRLIKEGAIEVFSQDPSKPADVKMLTNQLIHSETKIVIDDLYDSVLTICGVPRLNDAPSSGSTGQAQLIGSGWSMADERANQDELAFKKSERVFLKLLIDICKADKTSEITNLKSSDIEIKFSRNKNDNLLVKTQGLMNMKDSQVSPDIAFATCGLFSDSNEVYMKSKDYYGDSFWKSTTTNNNSGDNSVKDTIKTQIQSEDGVNLPKNNKKNINNN